jgi:hypothetical protein
MSTINLTTAPETPPAVQIMSALAQAQAITELLLLHSGAASRLEPAFCTLIDLIERACRLAIVINNEGAQS